MPKLSLKERFDDKWICSMGGCFEWIASTTGEDKRAAMHVSGKGRKMSRASHVAWFLGTGEWPEKGVLVCHKCDNPRCVRFDHLFLGSHSDNSLDSVRKGRARDARGENNPLHKLSGENVRFIRENVRKFGDKARMSRLFNVSQSLIGYVVSGKYWSHV